MNQNPSFSDDLIHLFAMTDTFFKGIRIEKHGNQYKTLGRTYPFYSDCTKAIDEAEMLFNKNCKPVDA